MVYINIFYFLNYYVMYNSYDNLFNFNLRLLINFLKEKRKKNKSNEECIFLCGMFIFNNKLKLSYEQQKKNYVKVLLLMTGNILIYSLSKCIELLM